MLYKIGKSVSIGKNYIILESNYKGEIVYVPRPNDFIIDKIIKVFIYEYKYETSLLYMVLKHSRKGFFLKIYLVFLELVQKREYKL